MSKSKSWFIACFGTLFSSVFVIAFAIMMIYKNAGFDYFPDWNSFIVGYQESVWSGGYGDFMHTLMLILRYLIKTLTDALTFKSFGGISDGDLNIWGIFLSVSVVTVWNVLPLVFHTFAIAVIFLLYVVCLTVPLLASVAWILSFSITANNIAGSMPPVEFYSGVGYPPVTTPVVSSLATFF